MERKIDLHKITTRASGMSYTYGRHLLECCIVSLMRNKHEEGVPLSILNLKNFKLALHWDLPGAEQLVQKYPDNEKTIDQAAECLSVLVALRLTKNTIIERSVQKTGFEYWLGDKNEPLFHGKARLKTAGVLSGDHKEVEARFKQEYSKLKPAETTELPGYVSVVEFSQPGAKFAQKP